METTEMRRFNYQPYTCDTPMVQDPYGVWIRYSDFLEAEKTWQRFQDNLWQDLQQARDECRRKDEEIDRLQRQNTRLIARLQKVSEAIDPSVEVQP